MKLTMNTLFDARRPILCTTFIFTIAICSVSARITPKEVEEPTKVYEIQNGDTLAGLAQKFRADSRLWRDFEKYNVFSNPHVIFPYENLQVPIDWALPGVERANRGVDVSEIDDAPVLIIQDSVTKAEFDVLADSLAVHRTSTEASLATLRMAIEEARSEAVGSKNDISGLADGHRTNQEALSELGDLIAKSGRRISRMRAFLGEIDLEPLERLGEENRKSILASRQVSKELRADINQFSVDIGALKTTQMEMQGELDGLRSYRAPERRQAQTRTFAILTAMLGGAAWLAVNAMGDEN